MPILGLLCLAWIVSIWINLTVLMVFTYRNIDSLENRLSGCQCIDDTRRIWGEGFVGRQMRLNMVLMVTYMHGILYRRGDITKNAHLSIPRQLKWWIWGIYGWTATNMAALAVVCYSIKMAG